MSLLSIAKSKKSLASPLPILSPLFRLNRGFLNDAMGKIITGKLLINQVESGYLGSYGKSNLRDLKSLGT
jgi:hypothetical protein